MKWTHLSAGCRQAGPALAVAVLVLVLFVPVLQFGFAGFDDTSYVESNPQVRHGLSPAALRWAWTTAHAGYWAPVLWMSYQADASLWGPDPGGFHLTNAGLHALNAGLLCWLLRRWTKSPGLAVGLALLWAVHPLRVESVAWIAERKGVLSGLFFLLCLHFYTAGGESRGWKYAAGAISLMLGMWVKPGVLLATPFVLLLLDVWPLRRFDWSGQTAGRLLREKWAYWLPALGFGLLAWRITRAVDYVRADMPPTAARLLLVPGNYLAYLRQAVWPAELSVLYPTPVFQIGSFLAALTLLGGGLFLAWKLRGSRPEVLVGMLWSLGLLLPSIGLVWTGTTEGLGDRFSYLPGIGVCILGAGIYSACRRPAARRLLAGFAVLALAGSAWASHRQQAIWRGAETLMARAVAVAPKNVVARIGYGDVLARQKQWAAALREYEQVLATANHLRWQAVVPAARAWVQLGEPERALAQLAETGKFDPKQQSSRELVMGQALLDAGRAAEAVPHLQAVVRRHPELTAAWPDFLRACLEAGRGEEGLQLARQLTRFDGRGLANLEDLMPFYLEKWAGGEKPRALAYFRRLIERNTGDPLSMNNFAWLLAVDPDQTADPQLALDCARKSLALGGSEKPAVWDTLAVALANAGDFPGAVVAGEQARRLAQAAGETMLVAEIDLRLAAFRSGRAWREPAQAPWNTSLPANPPRRNPVASGE